VLARSTALDHQSYIAQTWPASQRWNTWAATCKTSGCNILDAVFMQRLALKMKQIEDIVIDGDAIVRDYDDDYKDNQPERPWAKYAGMWSFDATSNALANNSKCFRNGPGCMSKSVLQYFPDPAAPPTSDTAVLSSLNAASKPAGAPMDVTKVIGGIVRTPATGPIASASALSGTFTVTRDVSYIQKTGRETDPLADEWEEAVLCALGIDARDSDDDYKDCAEDELLQFTAQVSGPAVTLPLRCSYAGVRAATERVRRGARRGAVLSLLWGRVRGCHLGARPTSSLRAFGVGVGAARALRGVRHGAVLDKAKVAEDEMARARGTSPTWASPTC
jgi:hypothetical protein